MIARRALVAAVAVALLAGCTTTPNWSDDPGLLGNRLEEAIEAVPGVTGASVTVNNGSIGVSFGTDAATEQDYLDTLEAAIAACAESTLGQRKRIAINASPEGTLSMRNVDPADLDTVLAAARILWKYSTDDAVEIDSASNYGYLAAREFGIRLYVADESLVAPTLAELTALVDDAGLLHSPVGLRVEVSP